jgi:hypothetical protein
VLFFLTLRKVRSLLDRKRGSTLPAGRQRGSVEYLGHLEIMTKGDAGLGLHSTLLYRVDWNLTHFQICRFMSFSGLEYCSSGDFYSVTHECFINKLHIANYRRNYYSIHTLTICVLKSTDRSTKNHECVRFRSTLY